jgi:hypothetical protein
VIISNIRVFERAGVAYGSCLEPSTEASTEDPKKRKADACIRPTGKQVKVAGKKKVAATPKGATMPKAAVAPKGAAAAMLKIAAAPKVAARPKDVAAPKAATAAKVAAAKAATLAAPSTIGGAITSKAAIVGQKGAPGATKDGVLKIKVGVKRPASMELSLVKTAKQPKVAKASSSVLASTQKVVAPSLPVLGSDDDRVEFCSMLGVASTMSSSSSSSSNSLASGSARAPQPNPDTTISSTVVIAGSKLPVIPEMPELDVTWSEMEREGTGPNAPLVCS